MGSGFTKAVGPAIEMGLQSVSHGVPIFNRVKVSSLATFNHMVYPCTKKLPTAMTRMLENNKLPMLSQRIEQAEKLHNGYDDTPAPDVAVFYKPEDLNRLLGSDQKYKYMTGQSPSNPYDVKIFLCEDVSGAHKTLAKAAEAFGGYEVVMAGRVKGSANSRQLTHLDNTSGHYQPKKQIPVEKLPEQFQVTERAFAKLGWTGYGKSFLWEPRFNKYLPDTNYSVHPNSAEFRPGSSTDTETKASILI